MIANKTETQPSLSRRLLPWLNLILVFILLGLGIWYLGRKVSLADILEALRLARPLPILLGMAVMLFTIVVKTWRWGLMFSAEEDQPSFMPLFWSLSLGQYVNLIVPFLRLGEIARIYALNRQSSVPMAQSIGTLVLEKVLDLFMLVLTIGLLLPFVILPEFVNQPGPLLWIIPIGALIMLYILAFQTTWISGLLLGIAGRLPGRWGKRILQWLVYGLEGLSALRSPQTSLLLVASSALIAILSILLPYTLFFAFDLRLTLVQAALLHAAVTIVTTPPSTPGKIGVFNGVVALMLYSFGIADDAVIIGYSIVFHLVVVLPQIILGSLAALRTDWKWQKSLSGQEEIV
jgi:uncharacterized protein (TIRG00374 family)